MRGFVKVLPKQAIRVFSCLLASCLIGAPLAMAADQAVQPITSSDTKHGPIVAKAPIPTELVLPNGLKLLMLEDHTLPVVSCLAWYRVGSRDERSGSTGITHLLEHMLFGNVGTFRKGEIGASIARVGGQFNGYTSDDFTTFFETLPAAKLELALRIESERMRSAKFTDAEVQEEISNIQHEFENEAKDPVAVVSHEVRSMLYATHPYHNPTMGWRSDVESLTAAQLKTYYDQYFWPNNCTLVLSGDFDSKNAAQLVQRYFASLTQSPQPVPQVKAEPEAPRPERRSVVKHSGSKEILQMAFNAPAFDDADAPAMVVLEKLLNAPSAGRFKSKLIDARVCSTATCAFEAKRDPGFIAVTCIAIPATPNAQQKITDAVDAILSQIRTQPVSDAELRRARNQAEFAFFSEREGPYRAGFHLGYFDNLSGWKNASTWPDKIRNVCPADILRVAKRYLNPEMRVVSWLSGAAAKPAGGIKGPEPTVPPARTNPTKPEHVRLTGYKEDDNSVAPDGDKSAQSAVSAPIVTTKASVDSQESGKLSNQQVMKQAIQGMPGALPNAVQKLPSAVGGAPANVFKELPNAVEAVPTVIKNLPSAVGNIPSVIKQIPSTLGSVPSAIREIPGALGHMPGAAANVVKDLPAAIGGIPGSAASALRELPSAIGGIPGAAAGAIKSVPAALGTFATDLGGIPGAIGRQLAGIPENKLVNGTSHRTLKNGMTLIVHESQLSSIVQVAGAIRAGSAYEPAGKRGVSRVTAALFNQGTARRGVTQIVTQQEDFGIQPFHMLRFDNDVETVQFATRCLSRDLGSQFELIAETLMTPSLNDGDFDKAKQETILDTQRCEDTNGRKAERALYRSLLAHGSPFSPEDPSQMVKSVGSLTVVDQRKFLSSYVVPSATTLVVVGDIDPDKALRLAEKAFGAWSGKGSQQKITAHMNARQVLRAAVPTKDKGKTTIGFGKLLPVPTSSPEYSNVLIADTIFSKHPLFSRLGQKLSQDPVLARAVGGDSIDTNLTQMADSLAWSFAIDVEPASVPITVSALQNQLMELSANGVKQQEFVEARRYLLGAIPVRTMSTLGSTARSLVHESIYNQDHNHHSNLLANLRATNLDSVNRMIKHTLRPETATMVVVGNSHAIRSTRNRVNAQTARFAKEEPENLAGSTSRDDSSNSPADTTH